MVKVNGTGLTISGYDENLLKAQLETYYPNSITAKTFLDLAASKVIMLYNVVGKPRKEGGKVLLFWFEQKETGLHHYGIKELGESALFETKNLLNDIRFNSVRAPTVLEFGLIKAKIEAESTVMIVKILTELQVSKLKYIPSAWGKRQILQLRGRTGNTAEEHIANTPHDSSQTNEFRLPSKYLYAYERLLKGIGDLTKLRLYLNSVVELRSPNGNTYAKTRFKVKMKTAFGTTFLTYGVSVCQIFVWLIYAIQSIENKDWTVTWYEKQSTENKDWTVTWKGGKTCEDYTDFADALHNVNLTPQILPNTRRVNEIKAILMDAIQNP